MVRTVIVPQPIVDHKIPSSEALSAVAERLIAGSSNKNEVESFAVRDLGNETAITLRGVFGSLDITPSSLSSDHYESMQRILTKGVEEYATANGNANDVARKILQEMLTAGNCPQVWGGNAFNFTSDHLALQRGIPMHING
jgi:hypothetical protein